MSEQEKKLAKIIGILIAEIEKLKQENKQLREALKKCEPFEIEYGCDGNTRICNFCDSREIEHEEDCEYIKLTEVQE